MRHVRYKRTFCLRDTEPADSTRCYKYPGRSEAWPGTVLRLARFYFEREQFTCVIPMSTETEIQERYKRLAANKGVSLNSAAVLTLAYEISEFRREQQATLVVLENILAELIANRGQIFVNDQPAPIPIAGQTGTMCQAAPVIPSVDLEGLRDDSYLTRKEIARRCNVTGGCVSHWFKSGQLPHHRVGRGDGRPRVTARDFKAFVRTKYAA